MVSVACLVLCYYEVYPTATFLMSIVAGAMALGDLGSWLWARNAARMALNFRIGVEDDD